ncbi:hypothetical protein BJ878DRAFT_297828 [Calycina marina]|uniref:Myb-like domain-containing protein n=1 Tax=Calycina marina TaxID=1763456 RepID=A0A9P7YV20_9HELO|nr:hypothetical protein BJ878DRAFT_297828 [Calycina marina]
MTPQTQSGKSIWNHEADKDLLLSVIAEGSLKGHNWASVSARMETKNYNFTKEACRQHFQKIRKEAGGNGGSVAATNGDNDSPAKSSPKRSRATETDAKGKLSKTAPPAQENDEGEGGEPSPSKRQCTVKTEDGVKSEGGDVRIRAFKMENAEGESVPLNVDAFYDAGV